MKKNIFWISYAVFVVVLVIAGSWAVGYVNEVLTDYEAAQPEKVVESEIERIKEAAAKDTLEEEITFFELKQAAYDIDISDFREYKDKIKNAKELTYKIKTGGYSESEQVFHILADDEIVAVLTLESVKEEIKLAILTVSDWQVKSVTPVITLVNYDYKVDAPKDYKVTINGTELTDSEDGPEEGWKTYLVATLYHEPEIKIYDEYGDEVLYDIVDNHVKPIVYTYHLRLPKSFSVSAGTRKQDGIAEGNEIRYSFTTPYEVLTLTDAHGNSIEYRGGDSIYTYDYTVRIPDNFQLSVNGKSAAEYQTAATEISKYQYCAEYAVMPKLITYEIREALCEPDFVLYDNLNQQMDCVFENYMFEVTEQSGLNTVPEEVAAQLDVLEIAQMWSRFMTKDLDGAKNGFETMKKYLIKDSYLYNVAYKWATNIDITFVSSHVLDHPPFSEEKVTNYISYGDHLFSCDISFLKHMDLVSRNMKVTDEMNSTFYFMYYDETEDGKDNPHWVILDIQEIVSK
ncbi:MAG: hypothetical protein ACI4FZ_11950 [Lachnospiraceae bacterium]